MRSQLAILLGKTISFFTRFLKIGGGSAAPGFYALKVYPNLLEKFIQHIPQNVIITGTNGKTTTARMLAHFAKESGLKVIRNHSGSNLERGIASTLIQNSNVHSRKDHLNYDLGIWELDEAAFNQVVSKIKPNIIVFLNVFRDQLDRYGEIDIVVKKWTQILKNISYDTIVIVNGDDANISKLKLSFKGKVYQFGVSDYKILGESIIHKREKENLDYEAKNVKLKGLSGTSFQVTMNAEVLAINLLLPGIYHIYDFLAAFSAGRALGFNLKKMITSLKIFSPAFGRVEKLDFGYIFLIKNPAGATQVFQTIVPNLKKNDRLLFALNDNLADGTDVSWIWDAEFEKLLTTHYKLQTTCSGTRAYDLANRLKYAGFDLKDILVEPDLEQAFKQARKGLKGRLFILPTYTAMLKLQKILTKSGIKKPYWEER